MPKTTPESEYTKYMSTLQSKIRAEEVGLQSWKGGKRIQVAPVKMSLTDTLLAGDKLNKAQNLQNQMLEDYLEKQKTPIIRYDEFGEKIGEFKYREIPEPELEDANFFLPAITRTIVDRDGNEYEHEVEPPRPISIPVQNIEEAKANSTIRFQNDKIAINRDKEEAKAYIEDNENNILDINDEIIRLRQERERVIAELQTQYDTEYDLIRKGKNRKRKEKQLIIDTNEKRRIFLANNDRQLNALKLEAEQYRNEVRRYKDQLKELDKVEQDATQQFETLIAEINRVGKENKDKIKTYEAELVRMNTGPFKIEQNVDETDLEYAERLAAIANEQFPTERNLEKANQANKEELREKLGTLFRDRSLIDSIVNSLDLEKGVYLLNTQFTGFKTFFEKRYGEFNKTVKLPDILLEIERYFKEQTPQEAIKKQYEQALIANPRFNKQPSLSSSTQLAEPIPPIYSSSSSSFGLEPSELYEGSAESKQYEEDPDTGLIPLSAFEEAEVSVPATIQPEPLPNKDNVQTLRFIYPTLPNQPRRVAFLKRALVQKDSGPPKVVPFVSATGEKGSYVEKMYRQDNTHGVKETITKLLGTPNWLGNGGKKNELQEMMDLINLEIDNGTTIRTYDKKGALIFKGLGLKMSSNVETIPTIINFGLVFLLLRKLYLNNILSIQNKHYKKVNGFNNVKVSDTFVQIIEDILNEKNYISKLSHLSQNEREIFDHLLYLAGLHKQLNGGSVADYDKLKKQLEILEGEIAAGNNNILLKKKLFNLLQKMAHYKMISSHGAQKHYKQFEQYFK